LLKIKLNFIKQMMKGRESKKMKGLKTDMEFYSD
jgi:hypothetical protein